MRFLITGIGGFAGCHLAALLLERGHDVFGLRRRPEVTRPLEALGRRFTRFDAGCMTVGDIRQRAVAEAVVRQFQPDAVFHLAAQSFVGSSESDAEDTFSVNTLGTLQVLTAVRAAGGGRRVMLAGSGESYGWSADTSAIEETVALRPATIYGVSKAAAELLARQAVEGHGVDVVCARAFNHTGPGQSPRFVCADFARQIAEIEAGRRGALTAGNLEAVRDFSDVRDVVRAYACLWERGERGGVYNVASGVGRRIVDVLADLCQQAAAPVTVEADRNRIRPVDVPVLIGRNGRARSLGWQPAYPWKQTLGDLLADWRERLARGDT